MCSFFKKKFGKKVPLSILILFENFPFFDQTIGKIGNIGRIRYQVKLLVNLLQADTLGHVLQDP
jgi:hypothetical protein